MWRGCGCFSTYLCLVRCPLRSTTVEEESDFFNTSLAAAHFLLLQTTLWEKNRLVLFGIRVSSLQQLHWFLLLCKLRLSLCLCLKAVGNISTKRDWLLHQETQFSHTPWCSWCWPLTPNVVDSTSCAAAYRCWSVRRLGNVVFAASQCCFFRLWSGDVQPTVVNIYETCWCHWKWLYLSACAAAA